MEHNKVNRHLTDHTLPQIEEKPQNEEATSHTPESEHQHASRPTDNANLRLVLTGRQAEPRQILALQRLIGNRTVQRLLAEQATPEVLTADGAVAPVQRTPVQINRVMRDGPYTGRARFEADFQGEECQLLIKVRLVPGHGVSPDDVTRVQQEAQSAFQSIFDNKYALIDMATVERYYLRVNLSFVQSGQHVRIRLRRGSGRDDESTWFVNSIAVDRAHELGHVLGLNDEYIDRDVPNRRTARSSGVHTDHSIMGNYYDPAEGPAQARMHQRHAQSIAALIGRVTGQTFTVTTRESAAGMY